MDGIKRLLGMALLSAFLVWIIAAWNAPDPESSPKSKPLIGFAMCGLFVERWFTDEEALTAELSHLGADLIVQNANNRQELQNQQIEDLIAKGIDTLIIIPVSSTGCRQAVAKAKSAGIRVIAYERLVMDTDIDLYISFDNQEVGRHMGEGLQDALPDGGQILLINGDEQDRNSALYREGYLSVLQPGIDAGRYRVIGENWSAGWTKEDAYRDVLAMLDTGTQIDGIIAENDSLAEMAVQALAEKGLLADTAVVGQDGDLAACQRIVSGMQTATVCKPYTLMAQKAALAAYRMSLGKAFSSNGSIDNGYRDIPCFLFSSQLVNSLNIESVVINGGIYGREEVYRNIDWLYPQKSAS